MTAASLNAFSKETFSYDGKTRDVYTTGSGPAVVVMAEIPGITPDVAAFAERVADAGFTVFVPDLFGVAGKPFSNAYAVQSFVKACVSKEFVAFARDKKSPITVWLGGLVQHAHERCGGNVGVVGMCFTGGFALALAVDPVVRVATMSQPALPMSPGAKSKRSLGLPEDDLRIVKERAQQEELCVIGLRFTKDPIVPEERFARLRAELGDAFIGVEIDNSAGNPHGFTKMAHSVVTAEYRDEEGFPTKDANDLVIEHFERLLPSP